VKLAPAAMAFGVFLSGNCHFDLFGNNI